MSIEHIPANDWAAVGALLARCRYVEIGRNDSGWWAWARLLDCHRLCMGEGKTQLEAIRAAVDAAEQGVRE